MLQITPLRYLGASLSFAPIGLYAFIMFSIRLLRSDSNKKIEVYLICGVIYTLLLSTICLFTLDNGGISTQFLVSKLLNNVVLNVLIIYPMFLIPSPNGIFRLSVWGAFAVSLLGFLVIDVLQVPGLAPPSLFKLYWGVTSPSGFSLEQSTFAATVTLLGLLCACITRSRAMRLFAITTVILFALAVTQSKGTIICILLALGLPFVQTNRQGLALRFAALIVVGALAYLMVDVLADRFQADLDDSTSSSTRSVFIFCSLVSTLFHPLGVGYANYLPSLIEYTPTASEWMQKIFGISITLEEFYSYVGNDLKEGLNIKAQVFEYIMVFGLPGLAVMIIANVRLYRGLNRITSSERIPLLWLFWFLLLSALTYIPTNGLYVYSICYGFLFTAAFRMNPAIRKDKGKPRSINHYARSFTTLAAR